MTYDPGMKHPRKRYLDAMVRGYFGPKPVPRETLDLVRPGLLAALDEVEPLIRAEVAESIAVAIEGAPYPEREETAYRDGWLAAEVRDARLAREHGRVT